MEKRKIYFNFIGKVLISFILALSSAHFAFGAKEANASDSVKEALQKEALSVVLSKGTKQEKMSAVTEVILRRLEFCRPYFNLYPAVLFRHLEISLDVKVNFDDSVNFSNFIESILEPNNNLITNDLENSDSQLCKAFALGYVLKVVDDKDKKNLSSKAIKECQQNGPLLEPIFTAQWPNSLQHALVMQSFQLGVSSLLNSPTTNSELNVESIPSSVNSNASKVFPYDENQSIYLFLQTDILKEGSINLAHWKAEDKNSSLSRSCKALAEGYILSNGVEFEIEAMIQSIRTMFETSYEAAAQQVEKDKQEFNKRMDEALEKMSLELEQASSQMRSTISEGLVNGFLKGLQGIEDKLRDNLMKKQQNPETPQK